MNYAQTDIHAVIKRLEKKHGKEVVHAAMTSYIQEVEFESTSEGYYENGYYVRNVPDDERWAGDLD